MTNIEKMSSISRIEALYKINNSGERFLMHVHNNYEIYVSLSNNNKFFIGHRIYDVNVTTCFCSTIRTHIKSTLSTPTTTSVTSSCFRLSCFPNPPPNCTNCSAVSTRVSKTAATNCPCCPKAGRNFSPFCKRWSTANTAFHINFWSSGCTLSSFYFSSTISAAGSRRKWGSGSVIISNPAAWATPFPSWEKDCPYRRWRWKQASAAIRTLFPLSKKIWAFRLKNTSNKDKQEKKRWTT